MGANNASDPSQFFFFYQLNAHLDPQTVLFFAFHELLSLRVNDLILLDMQQHYVSERKRPGLDLGQTGLVGYGYLFFVFFFPSG